MTVQEIQEIGFEKAVFGGYDMKSVDTFLERVAEEFASMQKENAALKAKMKVLVDKIEEYRGVEDGMRRALMRLRQKAWFVSRNSLLPRHSLPRSRYRLMSLSRRMNRLRMRPVNSILVS